MFYSAHCSNCGPTEIQKPMLAKFPVRHACGGKLKRQFTSPAVHYHAPGFFSSDVGRLRSVIGHERYARFEHVRDDIEKRTRQGKLTAREKYINAHP